MKKFIFSLSILAALFAVTSCNNDDDNPEPVNEEELITTVNVTLTPQGAGTPVTMQFRDLDAEGPDQPVIAISGPLSAATTYDGTIQFLNETESPAEDITEEVEEEDDEHQVFFFPAVGLDVTVDYSNFDGDGNPLGTEFVLTTGNTGGGALTIALVHEPKKPNDGTLADAGGETDVEVTFTLAVN